MAFQVLDRPTNDYTAAAAGLSTKLLYSRANRAITPSHTRQITIVSQLRAPNPRVIGSQPVNSRMSAEPATLNRR